MALGPWTEYKKKEKEKQVSQTERTTKSNRRVEAGRAIIIHYAERAWDTEKKNYLWSSDILWVEGVSLLKKVYLHYLLKDF